ncbi:MAG: polyprenyl synthetase family protein [Patescibacteria group bacterium]
MYLNSIVQLLKSYSRSDQPVLSILEFKQKFDAYLEVFLAQKVASAGIHTSDESIKKIIAQAALIAHVGGKRVRPYMAYLGYSMSGGINNDTFFDALVGIELFHTFALIHDDIIDESDERHAQATVHTFAENLFPNAKRGKHFGTAQAILAGDLVFAWSQEALMWNTKPSCLQDVRSIFSKMIEEVVVGQMIDVSITNTEHVKKDDIEEKNKLKTARYTFVNPLKIGAALAGDAKTYDAFFEEFGMALGTGYQVQDDLLDICGDPKKTGKDSMRDLEEGQHTYFTQYIFDEGTEDQKNTLMLLFGKVLTESQIAQAKVLFESSGALAAGRIIIDQKLAAAEKSLTTYSIPQAHCDAFTSILSLIKQRSA